MTKKKKSLTDFHPNQLSQHLIGLHTIDAIHSEKDLDIVKYHIRQTLNFTKMIINSYGDKKIDKLKMLDLTALDIDQWFFE